MRQLSNILSRKSMMSLCCMTIITSLLFTACAREVLIGKTRSDLLLLLDKYPRTKWNGVPKIVIGYDSTWHYYDNIQDIQNDIRTMNAPYWEIFRKETFSGWTYSKVHFSKNIVNSQVIQRISDGP